jgi:hypothetical protein
VVGSQFGCSDRFSVDGWFGVGFQLTVEMVMMCGETGVKTSLLFKKKWNQVSTQNTERANNAE